jgi:hypothetical protein
MTSSFERTKKEREKTTRMKETIEIEIETPKYKELTVHSAAQGKQSLLGI